MSNNIYILVIIIVIWCIIWIPIIVKKPKRQDLPKEGMKGIERLKKKK